MEKVNDKGQTLEQFLKEYDANAWQHPSYTTDAILFSDIEGKASVLLVKRKNHPYIGEWALPGGFVEEGESAETAVERELWEETGVTGAKLEQLYTVSTPNRDPRVWTVTTVFFAAVNGDSVSVIAGDDAAEAMWFNINYISVGSVYKLTLTSGENSLNVEMDVARTESGKIDVNNTRVLLSDGVAFDHAKLILLAIEAL